MLQIWCIPKTAVLFCFYFIIRKKKYGIDKIILLKKIKKIYSNNVQFAIAI